MRHGCFSTSAHRGVCGLKKIVQYDFVSVVRMKIYFPSYSWSFRLAWKPSDPSESTALSLAVIACIP